MTSPGHLDIKSISKRLQNNDCPFSLVVKHRREKLNGFETVVEVEWNHNHPIKSLQAMTFHDIINPATKLNIIWGCLRIRN